MHRLQQTWKHRKLAWKYRSLWKYRAIWRHRKEIAAGAITGIAIGVAATRH